MGEGGAPAFLPEKQVTGLLGTGPAAKGKPETMKESLAGWLGRLCNFLQGLQTELWPQNLELLVAIPLPLGPQPPGL